MIEKIKAHYLQHWGEPSRRARFQTSDLVVEIFKWDADKTDEGVDIYATAGGSTLSTDQTHRAEYILGLLPGRDEVAPNLAKLAVYSHEYQVELDHGHTVPVDGGVWPGSEMGYFLITRYAEPLVPTLVIKADVHVEFLQATPIYESEREFKKSVGVDALIERWADAETPFWSPRRSSNP